MLQYHSGRKRVCLDSDLKLAGLFLARNLLHPAVKSSIEKTLQISAVQILHASDSKTKAIILTSLLFSAVK